MVPSEREVPVRTTPVRNARSVDVVSHPAVVENPRLPRKPVDWRKVALRGAVPALLLAVGICTWVFLPRTLLSPQRIANILDQPTVTPVLSFGGRSDLRVMAGGNVWLIPSGKALYQGLNISGSLSPDGEKVISSGTVFNLSTKKITSLASPERDMTGSGKTFSITRHANRDALVASTRNASLYLLDATSGKIVHILREVPQAASAESCYVTSVGFSPDDSIVAAGDSSGNVSLWNAKEGDLEATLSANPTQSCRGTGPEFGKPSSAVWALDFSPDNQLLVSEDAYGVVRIWQVASRKLIQTLPFHLQPGRMRVKFSHNGKFLVTSGGIASNGTSAELYLVWSASDWHLLRTITVPGPGTFDFATDGTLALAYILNNRVKVETWDLRSRIRIPFTHAAPSIPEPADAALLAVYEEEALAHLYFLRTSIGQYRSASGGRYPQNLTDVAGQPDGSPEQFLPEIHGYRFEYKPSPTDDQGRIATYSLAARPLAYQQTGTRSFLMDQTGDVHSTAEFHAASTADPLFRKFIDEVQTASRAQATTPTAVSAATPTRAISRSASQASSPVTSGSAQPVALTAEANQWVARAATQFQQGDYDGALQSCDTALRLDASNARARQLKAKVEETKRILGKN